MPIKIIINICFILFNYPLREFNKKNFFNKRQKKGDCILIYLIKIIIFLKKLIYSNIYKILF